MKNKCLAVVAALLITLTTAHAADFDKGFAAYGAGDYATAFVEFSELAELGNADAHYGLALMYYLGKGVVQDYTEAAKYYTFAATQEGTIARARAIAQNMLGVMYYAGDGVLQDYILAHMWANIAAANGNEKGANNRDFYTEKMVQADIATAQKMARECMASNYESCGY